MSEERVEIVRAMIEAFPGGNAEAALAGYSEDVVFEPLIAGTYNGRAGVAEQMNVSMEEFDGYWFRSEELIDAGEWVVLVWRHGGRGRTSGIETEDGGATAFTIEGGLITHARVYADRAQALEAAGLSE
jgi:ketosteroid isomerase-like protein